MKRQFFGILLIILVASSAFAFVVPSAELTAKYGISYAERQTGYVEKSGYSFRYLGNGTWDVKPVNQTVHSTTSDAPTGFIMLLILLGVIIVIGVCVSNITTTVAKNSGMDERSAKKVGTSAGVLAGTAATIAAALLLGKAGGRYQEKKQIDITHHYR